MYTTIKYEEWKKANTESTYDRVTYILALLGCSIGVAVGVNESAKKKARAQKWRRYTGYDTAVDALETVSLGVVCGGLMYFNHITLPVVVAGSGLLIARDALAAFYDSETPENNVRRDY